MGFLSVQTADSCGGNMRIRSAKLVCGSMRMLITDARTSTSKILEIKLRFREIDFAQSWFVSAKTVDPHVNPHRPAIYDCESTTWISVNTHKLRWVKSFLATIYYWTWTFHWSFTTDRYDRWIKQNRSVLNSNFDFAIWMFKSDSGIIEIRLPNTSI